MGFEFVGVGNRRSLAKARSTMLRTRSAANSAWTRPARWAAAEVVPVAGLGWRETFAKAAGAAMGLPAAEVDAQVVPGAIGQPRQREERHDERSPAVRESETYDPKGVRLGGFKLFGTLEADEVFNDNVYATGEQAAFIQLINPTLELKSDWTSHMLNAYAKGGFGFYSVDGARNNYQESATKGCQKG